MTEDELPELRILVSELQARRCEIEQTVGASGVHSLDPEADAFLFVMQFLDEVSNGGVHQYLTNSSGDHVAVVSGWLRENGLEACDEVFEGIEELAGPDSFSPSRSLRNRALNGINEEQFERMEGYDSVLSALYPQIYRLLRGEYER